MTLLSASLQFPTVVFTIGLGIALLYWVFVLLGMLDLDLFGGGDLAGAGKGLGDVIASGKGGAEALKGGHDADGLLGGVPVTISLSIVLLAGWCGSLLTMQYGGPSLASALGKWVPALVLPLSLVVAILIASVLVRPLRRVFRVTEAKSRRAYVGHACTISTGRVDAAFGQADLIDGGSSLVIQVRCDLPGSALGRGDRARIVGFDDAREAFVVEPDLHAEPSAP